MNTARKWGGESESTDKEIKVQQRENWNDFSLRNIIYRAHRGRRWDIIRSASSGVGGENFSSGGTVGCVERAGCATSSVGWKSGTNFALERNLKRENLWIKILSIQQMWKSFRADGKKGEKHLFIQFPAFLFGQKSRQVGSEGEWVIIYDLLVCVSLFFGGTKN